MPDADDPIASLRLEALREEVRLGWRSAVAGRLVDGRVVEHELRQDIERRLETRRGRDRRRR